VLPPLVVAYALAGTADIDLVTEPLGTGVDGKPVFLTKDIWPSQREVSDAIGEVGHAADVQERLRRRVYAGDPQWRSLVVPEGDPTRGGGQHPTSRTRPTSTGTDRAAWRAVDLVHGDQRSAVLGDSITTDHISPAGSIKADGPAGKYLIEHGVMKEGLQPYGSRRGKQPHEVIAGAARSRTCGLRNQLGARHRSWAVDELNASNEVMRSLDAS
jgi:aconitate hydratase